ncbi:MAG: C69 family dipeptidase, partial [Bacteroidales bacterium]
MKLKAILIFCLALLPCISALPCTNLLISKGASKDGSVMVTYAADSHTRYGTLVYMPRGSHKPGEMIQIREWGKERLLGEIPQVPYTYNVIGNMNENQVVIGESTWGGLNEMRDTQAILDYGSLIYLSLQRAKTAREAIEIFTSLADKYGYASSGESISIGDPNEVWFLDIIGKKPRMENGVNVNKGVVWVAVRIPNGYISAHANCARIATFPLNDPQNCIYAKDVISHAREIGIYDGSDSDFSFADTYGPLDFSAMRGCEARVWSFFNKHGAEDMSKYLDFASGENPKNRMPLYVKAKSKLSVKNVADMMRDHFEGTPFDMTQDVGAGGNALPYRWRPMSFKVDSVTVTNERAICTQQTGFWFVGQCRGWLP